MEKTRRNTRQRQVILEELRQLRAHPTASELHAIVQRRLPQVSLGTVYRNLELLQRQGSVRKLAGNGRRARFDGDMDHHLHVRCIECGRIGDLPGAAVELIGDRGVEPSGFEVLGLRAEAEGICPECRRNRRVKDSARSR